jgi:hypothetical protein
MAWKKLRQIAEGETFTSLTAGKECGRNSRGEVLYNCSCKCGKQTTVTASRLLSGHTRSCGCLLIEVTRQIFLKHGQTIGRKRSPEHRVWQHMLGRCLCETDSAYKYYGERGIAVCQRWLDFTNFYADMGPRPSPQHSIDRINVNGDYCPENCRWATNEQQANNKRRTLWLGYLGTYRPLTEWSKELGIAASCLRGRLYLGWSDEEVLFGKQEN